MNRYKIALYMGAYGNPQAFEEVDYAQADNIDKVNWIRALNIKPNKYCRIMNKPDGTRHIDFGSWSEFIMIWED